MTPGRDDYSRTVYSTDSGRHCPQCGQPLTGCTCHNKQFTPGDGIVRLRVERKGRGGKTVTIVSGVPEDEAGLRRLVTELKRSCGAGGAVKDGVIEIQGERRSQILSILRERGYTVKG